MASKAERILVVMAWVLRLCDSLNSSTLEPWGMNWSGQPMRTTGSWMPASWRVSRTIEPKPLVTAWSSMVAMSFTRLACWRRSSLSMGLTKRALTTPTEIPYWIFK